jgi:branched-subunit amino acid transport protein
MSTWTVILLAGLTSYGLRVALVGSQRLRLPSGLDDTLGLVPPAAFGALALTALAAPVAATPTFAVAAPIVLSAAAGVVAGLGTGRPYAAMIAGLPTYWLTAALTG